MMLGHSNILLSFILATYTFVETTSIKTDQPSTIDQLERELEVIQLTTANLKRGNENLIQTINNTTLICNEKLSNLQKKHASVLTDINKHDPVLRELLQKIQNEEKIHEELENKLKQLYEDLDLFGVKYEIIYQDLVLLENRQSNGTAIRCHNLNQVNELSAVQNKLGVRSLGQPKTRLSGNRMKIALLQSKLRTAKLLELKLQSEHDESTMKLNSDIKICNFKESNLKQLIAYAEDVLKHSKASVEVLKSDFQASTALSESFYLEVQYGTKLLDNVKENINTFRKMKESFGKDEKCYSSVKKLTF